MSDPENVVSEGARGASGGDRRSLPRALRWLLGLVYLGVLVVVFVFTSYAAFSAFVRRGEVAVPAVAGLYEEQARAALTSKGLVVRRRADRDRFDPQVPPGQVLEQRPPAGAHMKTGATVELTLSRGRELVAVPDLRGQAIQEAQLNLRATGLALGAVRQVYAEGAGEGRVAAQIPEVGSLVDSTTKVDLLIGLRDSGRAFVMPDLVYRPRHEVEAFFGRRGFRLGSVKFEPYDGVEPGIVLRQYPLAGHALSSDDVISITVAADADLEGVG